MKNKSAAVLILTILFLAGITFTVQQFVKQIVIYSRFASITISAEKAKMLAYGGVNLAISQLLVRQAEEPNAENISAPKEDANKNPTVAKDESEKKALIEKILPYINRWQAFKLDEKIDGIEAEVKFCICCEDGKINLNEIYDFEKKEIKKDFIPLLDKIQIKSKETEKKDLTKPLTEFFKKRNKKLDDVSEIRSIPEFKDIPLFYTPPKINLKKGEPNIRTEALYDLFTIWSSSSSINVFLLSDSMCEVLKIRRPEWNDALKMKDKFNQVIKAFKSSINNWLQNWSIVQHIYDKKPADLEKIQRLFSQKFDPKVFSVLSSGTVNGVEQTVMAIICQVEEDEKKQTNEQSQKKLDEKSKEKESSKDKSDENKKAPNKKKKNFEILKFYWL